MALVEFLDEPPAPAAPPAPGPRAEATPTAG
jgi:hypothetical protein